MGTTWFLIGLAVAVAVIASVAAARATRLPTPVFLIPAGLLVSLTPGLPDVILEPDVVFFLFLPPLLYAAAFFTSPREWRANWRPISALAVGLVVATLFAVAGASVWLLGLAPAAAFVLGAVVAPTDPVAATSVMSRLQAPARLRTILEGESLVNDGVALVIYSVAVSAAVSGSFSVWHGLARFAETAAGGVALGLAVGFVFTLVRRRIHEPMIEITLSLLTPYLAYIPAEQAHVSGVLATVTTGAFLGSRSDGFFSATTRVQAFGFWEVLVFLLESSLFVLLGAQFPHVLGGLDGYSPLRLAAYALAVAAVVATVRMVWQFTVPHFVHALDVRFRELRTPTPWRERLLLGWAGMRGGVTLAAALAVPLALPGRPLVLFLSFSVILATILVQGVTLPWLVRALGLARREAAAQREIEARAKLAEAALARIDELLAAGDGAAERLEPLRQAYEQRLERFAAEADADDGPSRLVERAQLEAIRAQRSALRRLRAEGEVEGDVARRLQRELDLEESRVTRGS